VDRKSPDSDVIDPEDHGEEVGLGAQTELEGQTLLGSKGVLGRGDALADLKGSPEDVLEGDIPVGAPTLELDAEEGVGSDDHCSGAKKQRTNRS
jgi:hypothetical protein